MFNPKNNLLDQQLAESGLEMQIADILLGVSAVGSIIGGITGASEASKQNKAAKKTEKEQRQLAKEIAETTNEYNDQLDFADEANYYAMRKFSHKASLQNWKRSAEIQDFEYLNRLKQYEKSLTIGIEQLGLNAEAAAQGIEAEQDAIKDAFLQHSFQEKDNLAALKQTYVEGLLNRQEQGIRLQGIEDQKMFGGMSLQNSINQMMSQNALRQESAMVESLVKEGTTQLQQAGKSTARAQQSNTANLHRSLMALDSELSGKYKQAAIQMAELNAEASLAKAGVGLNLQRIDSAIQQAEETAVSNSEVMLANLNSQIKQAERNIDQINVERKFADVNTKANIMLPPERLPYAPRPELPPERIFVDRMEATPSYVPPARQQNVWAPLIQGVGNAAGTVAGMDFSK